MNLGTPRRMSPLFYVGILWLVLGITQHKTVYSALAVAFFAIGIARSRKPPTNAQNQPEDEPDTPG